MQHPQSTCPGHLTVGQHRGTLGRDIPTYDSTLKFDSKFLGIVIEEDGYPPESWFSNVRETVMPTLQSNSTFQLSHDVIMTSVKSIRPLPRSGMQLNKIFAARNYNLADVVRAIELDPALTGKLLQLSSGVNYGPRKAGSIGEAVVRLGASTVKSLAVAECMRPTTDLDLSFFGITAASYWKHSVTVVCFAEELAAQCGDIFGTDFSLAAILHDFGKAIVEKHVGSTGFNLHEQDSHSSASDLEHAIFGFDHAEVSAAAAEGWGLADNLIQSVRHHHRPELFDHPMCHGLTIANQLAWQLDDKHDDLQRESMSRNASIAALGLSPETLESVAVQGKLRLQQTLEAYT